MINKYTIENHTRFGCTRMIVEGESLHDAIDRFCRTIGLIKWLDKPGRDSNGIEYVTFQIGTGMKLICFAQVID